MRVHKFQRAHLKFHPKIETVHGKLCNWWLLFLCAIYDIVELWRHKSQWDCPGSSVQDISATITQRAASQTCGAKWFNIGEILCQDLPSFCKLSWIYRADFRFASSQWETSLQSNAAFHWLGASIESSLIYPIFFPLSTYHCIRLPFVMQTSVCVSVYDTHNDVQHYFTRV